MKERGALQATRVVPLMRYRDLPTAISWLSNAFGFEVHYTASDEDGTLIYAQMTYGNGMVMLGPVRQSDFDDLLSQPDEIGGTETQSCYLVVDDIEQHFERATEAGADIALDVQSDDTGGRAYSCRDCEGHLWNFGTFNPWQSSTGGSTALTHVVPRLDVGPISMTRSAGAVFAGLALAGVAIGVYTRNQAPLDHISSIEVVGQDASAPISTGGTHVVPSSAPVQIVASLRKQLQKERSARRQAEHRLATLRSELATQKVKAEQAVAATRQVSSDLSKAQGAERAALKIVERLRQQNLRKSRTANASVDDLHRLIEVERSAKSEALKATEAVKYELVLERQLRQQAERKAIAALKSGTVAGRKTATAKAPIGIKTQPQTELKAHVPKATVAARDIAPTKPSQAPVTVPPVEGGDAASADAKNKIATPEVTSTKKSSTKKKRPRRRKKVTSKTSYKKKPKPPNSSDASKSWPYNTW